MQVKDLMKKNPEIIRPDFSIQEAAQKMCDINTGILPVGTKENLLGTITDRDITIRATAKAKDAATTTVSEVMTREVFACYAEDDVCTAGNKMLSRHVGRLAVLDKSNNSLVGMISLADIIEKCGGEALLRNGGVTNNTLENTTVETIAEPV